MNSFIERMAANTESEIPKTNLRLAPCSKRYQEKGKKTIETVVNYRVESVEK